MRLGAGLGRRPAHMQTGMAILEVQKPVDNRLKGHSSWLQGRAREDRAAARPGQQAESAGREAAECPRGAP